MGAESAVESVSYGGFSSLVHRLQSKGWMNVAAKTGRPANRGRVLGRTGSGCSTGGPVPPAKKSAKIGCKRADMITRNMVFLHSLILMGLTVLAMPVPGQQTGQSRLALEVRPECGFLKTEFVGESDAREGVVRFLYAARTGQAGGRLEFRLPEGPGAALITTTMGGPGQARPPFVLAAGESADAATLPPKQHTLREGAPGEIRWRWEPGAQPLDKEPLILIVCN